MGPSRFTVDDREDQQVRSAWLIALLKSCQDASARLSNCERNDARDCLKAFTVSLELPTNQAEWLVLRGIVFAVAMRASAAQHGRLDKHSSERCGLKMECLLDDLAAASLEATIRHFESWQRDFFNALDVAHPSTLGSSIGVLVRRDFRSRWNLARLARHFKTSPSTIRKSFRRKFGRSVHEYQQVVRIVASLDGVRSTKVEPIARGVGYHSTKNFYSAFRRLIGRTPREYRMLPAEEASLLKAAASQQLTRAAQSPRPSTHRRE
jgi:AraC-like DNA-binding protein